MMEPQQAKEQFEKVISLWKSIRQEVRTKRLVHFAELMRDFGLEEAIRIQKEEDQELRKRQAIEEYAYTHLPCGCYRDPGGHP